jgi:hypothetical protein
MGIVAYVSGKGFEIFTAKTISKKKEFCLGRALSKIYFQIYSR